MKREVRRPSPVAASTCALCFRPGSISTDQTRIGRGKGHTELTRRIRFECASGHAWMVNAEEAEAHGRFLQRLEGA